MSMAKPEILKWEGPDIVEVPVKRGYYQRPSTTAWGWHYETAVRVCKHCRGSSRVCRCAWRTQ